MEQLRGRTGPKAGRQERHGGNRSGTISGGIWRNKAEFRGFRRYSAEFRHVFAGAVQVLPRSMEPTANATIPAPPPNNAVPRVGVFR